MRCQHKVEGDEWSMCPRCGKMVRKSMLRDCVVFFVTFLLYFAQSFLDVSWASDFFQRFGYTLSRSQQLYISDYLPVIFCVLARSLFRRIFQPVVERDPTEEEIQQYMEEKLSAESKPIKKKTSRRCHHDVNSFHWQKCTKCGKAVRYCLHRVVLRFIICEIVTFFASDPIIEYVMTTYQLRPNLLSWIMLAVYAVFHIIFYLPMFFPGFAYEEKDQEADDLFCEHVTQP